MQPRQKNLVKLLFPADADPDIVSLFPQIHKGIQHIPQPYRKILLSYYLEALDHATIAKNGSLAEATIRSYKQKAICLLRRKVNPAYYEEAKSIRKSLYSQPHRITER